ncbi:helix-turn-helix domain-containing protein [Shewanella indica]|uniref:helix-turn-helix domain-containing protein n=1 Tax=Shewanella indica TaxID=768528 RepID=UPI00313E153F
MGKNYNPNRVKINRSYTVIEVSEILQVHPKTVRNWIHAGLPVVDEKRPLLIDGAALRAHLKRKRKADMYPCEVHEMYCFKCREPNSPAIESLQFVAKPAGMAQMSGHCCECGSRANKYVSWRHVNKIWLELGGKLPIAEKHLILMGQALLNCPLAEVFGHE